MLLRIRWFVYGVIGAVSAAAYVLGRSRRMRALLRPRSAATYAAMRLADTLDTAGRRIRPSE